MCCGETHARWRQSRKQRRSRRASTRTRPKLHSRPLSRRGSKLKLSPHCGCVLSVQETGSVELHRAYDSDAFSVDFRTDYESSDPITTSSRLTSERDLPRQAFRVPTTVPAYRADRAVQGPVSRRSGLNEVSSIRRLRRLEGRTDHLQMGWTSVDGVTVGCGSDGVMFDSWGSSEDWCETVLLQDACTRFRLLFPDDRRNIVDVMAAPGAWRVWTGSAAACGSYDHRERREVHDLRPEGSSG